MGQLGLTWDYSWRCSYVLRRSCYYKLGSSPNAKSVVCTITHLFPHFKTRCRKIKGNSLYCVVMCCHVVLPCIVLTMLEIIPESLSEWKDQPFATQAFKTWNFRRRGRFCCENNLKLGKDGQILFHLLTKLFTTAVKFWNFSSQPASKESFENGCFLFAKEGETNKETVKTRIFRIFHFNSTATFSFTQVKIVLTLILLVKIRM